MEYNPSEGVWNTCTSGVNHHTFLVGLYNTFIFYETKVYSLYCFYLSKWRNAYIYLYFICRSTHIASLTHFIPDDRMYINIVMRFFFFTLEAKTHPKKLYRKLFVSQRDRKYIFTLVIHAGQDSIYKEKHQNWQL